MNLPGFSDGEGTSVSLEMEGSRGEGSFPVLKWIDTDWSLVFKNDFVVNFCVFIEFDTQQTLMCCLRNAAYTDTLPVKHP